ncbi:MAG: TRAP transporter large permease subunit [Desulfobacterales bacterium]|nr:TRAP transporter large permease subunit [Desulfobacterales bacterium]
MSIEMVTFVMFGGLMACLLLGLPLAWSLGGVAAGVSVYLWGFNGLMLIVYNTFGCMWSIVLVAIPLFMSMGILLERSGAAETLFETIHLWSGPIRGGIAMGVVVICVLFAAMTGVSAAATLTMGVIALPAMLKRGYDKSIAIGSIAGPGTLGILIPPSIISILLAIVGNLSVGKLFMAGIGPGVLLAGLFILYIGIRGWINPKLCPRHPEKHTLKEKVVSLKMAILPLLIILAVLGSIFFGVATPTEAGSLGVTAVLITVLIHRRFSWKLIRESSYETFRITGLTMWIFYGAMCFSAVYARAGGGVFISNLILGAGVNRWLIIISMMGISFMLGMFVDPFAIIFILAPICFPIVKSLGFDPVWFGILFVINMQMGYVTPPFGYQLFYLKSVAPAGVSTADIYRSVFPFLVVMVVGMALIMIFPQIALWLPELMMSLAE